MTDVHAVLLNEQSLLRSELQDLKKCQIQYFLLSVGATGAVFGFKSDFNQPNLVYLAPLVIILPCWLTFLDKANSISRIIGYVRVFIEDQLTKEAPIYIGYENALQSFRDGEKEWEAVRNRSKGSIKDFFYITRNQYWKINWLTFFLLSIACFLCTYLKSTPELDFLRSWKARLVCLVFIVAEIVTIFYSIYILWRLIYGRFSFKNVRSYWSYIFEKVSRDPALAGKPASLPNAKTPQLC